MLWQKVCALSKIAKSTNKFIGHRVTEGQSDRGTESQTPKGTQYKGGWNFFVPDFNKLPYSLRSPGNNLLRHWGSAIWQIFFTLEWVRHHIYPNTLSVREPLFKGKIVEPNYSGWTMPYEASTTFHVPTPLQKNTSLNCHLSTSSLISPSFQGDPTILLNAIFLKQTSHI